MDTTRVSRVAQDQAHRCDQACVCPTHPDLPLLYAALVREHACQDPDCEFAHGLETRENSQLWFLKHWTRRVGPEFGPPRGDGDG